MKLWNFGIIGAGVIADFHARAISDIENTNIIGFCDSGSGRAKKLAEKYACRAFKNYQDILNNDRINIVTIATPSGFHMEPTVAAAEAGKHVLCEKPLDVSLERIDTMIEAHKKAGTSLGGIFQNRFSDTTKPLKNAIDTNRFGKITYAGVYVPWWRSNEYYKDSWHGTWKLDGGGSLMNQSIHMVDMLCALMPPIETVQAYTVALGHPQIETEDTTVATLQFANSALGIIYGTTASYPGQPKRLEITGTKGTVVLVDNNFTVWQFDEQKPQDKEFQKQSCPPKAEGASDPAAITHQNHTRNFKAFIEALESNKPFSLNGDEARKAVQIVLAIYKSSAEQRPVRID